MKRRGFLARCAVLALFPLSVLAGKPKRAGFVSGPAETRTLAEPPDEVLMFIDNQQIYYCRSRKNMHPRFVELGR